MDGRKEKCSRGVEKVVYHSQRCLLCCDLHRMKCACLLCGVLLSFVLTKSRLWDNLEQWMKHTLVLWEHLYIIRWLWSADNVKLLSCTHAVSPSDSSDDITINQWNKRRHICFPTLMWKNVFLGVFQNCWLPCLDKVQIIWWRKYSPPALWIFFWQFYKVDLVFSSFFAWKPFATDWLTIPFYFII